ncbi:hypothetical protein [Methylobacterium haplocladii]|uniref:Uncharacterized protein n=1 Tax=Methylobacterium haplocladii TaxID=1176176 RepID=A0A512IS81_9HYPH|nr:hypothetical protein [Methylobacterium haplocladii]GEP00568.1 hypothetical protein MHA02_29550 [Methylobacterium haplocladii]GJD85483.1 hypothetical protein HPGCJGGD_3372 [Methylobacterium haplocladii]GLS57716.1 hypothetical protein GCM10007887_03720 [Methylobacterium haplocladii]
MATHTFKTQLKLGFGAGPAIPVDLLLTYDVVDGTEIDILSATATGSPLPAGMLRLIELYPGLKSELLAKARQDAVDRRRSTVRSLARAA